MVSYIQNIGVDLVEISRFEPFEHNKKHQFLRKVFTSKELDYCFGFVQPSIHLAGLFAAKEASAKSLGAHKYPFITLEIHHSSHGAPEVWHNKKQINISISITHTKTIAMAIALSRIKHRQL